MAYATLFTGLLLAVIKVLARAGISFEGWTGEGFFQTHVVVSIIQVLEGCWIKGLEFLLAVCWRSPSVSGPVGLLFIAA